MLSIRTSLVLLPWLNLAKSWQTERTACGTTCRILLADGRILPADYNTFTHGYAVTSHSSQGKTVDEVLLVASSKSFAAVNREQFYFSISRGRERVHVFTDDADLLARHVGDSHERKAAVKLEALRDELAKFGFIRRERTEGKTPASREQRNFRTTRSMLGVTRAMRSTRLARVQRIAQIIEDIARVNEVFGIDRKRAVAVPDTEIGQTATTQTDNSAIRQTDTVRRTRKIKSLIEMHQEKIEASHRGEPLRERLRQRAAQRREQK